MRVLRQWEWESELAMSSTQERLANWLRRAWHFLTAMSLFRPVTHLQRLGLDWCLITMGKLSRKRPTRDPEGRRSVCSSYFIRYLCAIRSFKGILKRYDKFRSLASKSAGSVRYTCSESVMYVCSESVFTRAVSVWGNVMKSSHTESETFK